MRFDWWLSGQHVGSFSLIGDTVLLAGCEPGTQDSPPTPTYLLEPCNLNVCILGIPTALTRTNTEGMYLQQEIKPEHNTKGGETQVQVSLLTLIQEKERGGEQQEGLNRGARGDNETKAFFFFLSSY